MTDPEQTSTKPEYLVETQPDYIMLRRFNYSLEKALKKYPEGLPENLVAQALGKPVSWVAQCYLSIVQKLRAVVAPK